MKNLSTLLRQTWPIDPEFGPATKSQRVLIHSASDELERLERENAELRRELDEAYEKCAQICDKDAQDWIELGNSSMGGHCDGVQAQGSKACADLIRALKSTRHNEG